MAETAARRNDFSKGSVSRAIIGLAVPMTAAGLVNILYNLVDRIYISRIPEIGDLALAGLGVCLPVITLVAAFARLCGTGGAPFYSIERGRGDMEKADTIMGNAMTMLCICAVILTAVGLLFTKPILYAFGASDVTYVYAAPYCRIYLMGNIFVLISSGMNPYINAQGFAKTGMCTVIIGAVINTLLDPLFIYVFGLGVSGAAIATVISQFISAAWVVLFLTGKRAISKLSFKRMILKRDIVGKSLLMGITGFEMTATNSLIQIIGNRLLRSFGGDVYVGIMTIISSVREFSFMPIQGISSGSQPVLGFNYGAGEYERVRRAIRFTVLLTFLYNISMWAAFMIFPRAVISVFTPTPAIVEMAVPPFRYYFCGFFMMAFMMSGQCTFMGLGQSKKALCFSLFRKAVMAMPLMLILPHLWGLGVTGVFISEPISSAIAGLACSLTMLFTVYIPLKRLKPGEELR